MRTLAQCLCIGFRISVIENKNTRKYTYDIYRYIGTYGFFGAVGDTIVLMIDGAVV